MGTGAKEAIKMPLRAGNHRRGKSPIIKGSAAWRNLAKVPYYPCQQAGWPLRLKYCVYGGEESPGSKEARCRITSGGGDPRDSATESKPPRDIGDGVAG